MKIKIRQFLPKDLNRVIEIAEISFPESYPASYFQKFHRNHPESFIVAEIEDKIVGYTIGHIKNGRGEINSLAVDPHWQKKGIGREITEFLVNLLKKKGAKEIYLRVRTNNQKAISLYQLLGFEIIKTIEKYYPDGENAYLMKKDLGA